MIGANEAVGILRREMGVAEGAGDERTVEALTLAIDSIDTIQVLSENETLRRSIEEFNQRNKQRGH